MAELPWYVQKPVPLSVVKTVAQAAAYCHGSYTTALNKCPGVAQNYASLRDKVLIGAYGPVGMDLVYPTQFKQDLSNINTMCKADSVYNAGPTDVEVVAKNPPGTPNVSITPITAGLGTGLPWWVWVLGGGVLYLLFKKKGKK